MRRLNLEEVPQGILYALTAESDLYDRIVTAQRNDADIQTIRQKLAEGVTMKTDKIPLPPARFTIFVPYFGLNENGTVFTGNGTGYGAGGCGCGTGYG
jgi:hypothetical protein